VILRARQNTWRIEPAARAALLIDAGQYFAALRQALLGARRTIFILGWDIDSRMRLVGETGKADDGLPEEIGPFLSELVRRRPTLNVYILMWDYSVLYALEREFFPSVSLRWRTPRRIRFCLDDDLPVGASHHQKIVVVDDTLAFCGGLDLTTRRWDTREHRLDNLQRVDPAGAAYAPFHDVQAVVDGKAALALAELARERWSRGACERASRIRPREGLWPKNVVPDLTDIDVGISRTRPASEDDRDIREVEALFLDSIDHAERMIYIETQYFTANRFVDRLAARMREKPELEMVAVTPKFAHSWLEQQTMQSGLLRSLQSLREAGLTDRIRLLYPQVREDDRAIDAMVHSKVMIVDDVLLRVGSANLNNRSLGLDTECDLTFEARTSDHRAAVARLRNGLLGHHCGSTAEQVAATLDKTGSLVTTALTLRGGGHALVPVEAGAEVPGEVSPIESFADPERPIEFPAFVQGFVGKRPPARRLGRLFKLLAFAFVIVALTLAWQFSPLSELLGSDVIRSTLAEIADMRGAPFIVVGLFVVGGLVVFPILLLIAATAATFGPWLGFAYAASGALASALVTYGLGALIGRRALDGLLGPRLNRVRRSIARRGVLAVAAVRMVPIAPFTLVNLVAGASRIPLLDYMLGTIIGMAPGIMLMSALGYQIFSILTEPTLSNMLLLVGALLVWIGLTVGVQALLIRSRKFQT
jgi:phosphatidylserine/phosphatidylglycerophosphate/cardiolipin synthase-like enzyme/membrane protein YqaA with SNARE-associated domain